MGIVLNRCNQGSLKGSLKRSIRDVLGALIIRIGELRLRDYRL